MGGRYLAAGYEDGTVDMVRVRNHMLDASVKAHAGSVDAISFSSDSKMLCTLGSDRTVHLYKVTCRVCFV